MLTRFALIIAAFVGVAVLGFVAVPSAHAGSYCIPFTQICISGYVENNSSYQFGVIGDGRDGPRTFAVLRQGETTADLRNQGILYDADFIYSTYYVIYDLRDDPEPACPGRVCAPLTQIKIMGGEAAQVVDTVNWGYIELRDR